jgi:bacillithiol biosynthesis cysteine-adding enzyme BshC
VSANADPGTRGLSAFPGYPFVNDWVAGGAQARALLPWHGDDWEAMAAARDTARTVPWGTHEIAELREFNSACGNAAGAALAGALSDPAALCIVTGQQPNLLASPLYILLKALTAAAKARAAEAATGRRVIPVFWIASDDHDFAELRQCWMRSGDRMLRDLGELVSRGKGVPEGSPAYAWKIGESAPRLLAALADLPAGHRPGPRATGLIRDALAPDATFETAFCRTMAALLDGEPMVFLAPRLACMRRRQLPVLRAAIGGDGAEAMAVASRGEALAAAGYPAAVTRDPGVVNAFLVQDGVRCRLVRRQGAVEAQRPGSRAVVRKFAREELLSLLESEPDAFSPNVVTRPVVQDSALPVLAYVGGPGEIAYLAQVRAAYGGFGVAPAAVLPRATATILDGPAVRALREAGGNEQELLCCPEMLVRRVLARDERAAPLLEAVRALEAAVTAQFEAVAEAGAATHPHVQKSLHKTRRSMRHALDRLQARLTRHFASSGGEAWAGYARLTSLVRPAGAPQERMLSPFTFCSQTNPADLAARLRSRIDFASTRHQVVHLEPEADCPHRPDQ